MCSSDESKRIWAEKKKFIITNIDEAIAYEEQALVNMSKANFNLKESIGYTQEYLNRLKQMQYIYESNAYVPANDVTYGSIDIINGLSASSRDSARYTAITSEALRKNSENLRGTIIASGSLVASMVSNTSYLSDFMIDKEPILGVINQIKEPSAQTRTEELTTKLNSIKPQLSTKLNGAWQTLMDPTNIDRVSQAANSTRELISDFLKTIVQDDKVKLAKWFKIETETGAPSQGQRAKYAIVGKNEMLHDEILTPIADLSKNIRDSYTMLSSIAHQRDYTHDLQVFTESIIDSTQIYLLELLKLRHIYFKE